MECGLMGRQAPYPIAGLYPFNSALTTRRDGIGTGSAVAAGFGPGGTRTPGLAGLATEPAASGTKYYVGDSGNDGNSGTAKDDAFRTFAPVSSGGSDEATSGDVIVILSEGVTLTSTSGRFVAGAADITVCGEGGSFPTVQVEWTADTDAMRVDNTGCVFRGLHLNGPNSEAGIGGPDDGAAMNGIHFNGVDSGYSLPLSESQAREAGWVYNVKVTRFGRNGILVDGDSSGVVAERCHSAYHYGPPASESVGGRGANGIQMADTSTNAVEGGHVLDCLTNHNSSDGVDLRTSRGVVIKRCLSYSNGYREDGSVTGIETAGKGFKLGGGAGIDVGGTVIQRSIACNNGGAGFGASGANLPIDILFCTGFNNARKDGSGPSGVDRSYELDYELYESPDTSPSGFQLQDSRIVGCLGDQGLYTEVQDGSIDNSNITTSNFDVSNTFSPAFSAIGFASTAFNSEGYPRSENSLGRIDTREDASSLPTVINSGAESYHPTPASSYHGVTTAPAYSGSAPDIGAFETTTASTPSSGGSYGIDGYGDGGWGGAADYGTQYGGTYGA